MNDQRIALRQRRDLSEIIQAALNVYQQNLAPLFLIASVVVPVGIAGAVFEDPFIYLAITLLQLAVGIIAGAAVMFALSTIDTGQEATFSETYDAVFDRLGTLIVAHLRSFAIIVLLALTIIGIPWAIQRLVRWLFVGQAVVFDDTTAKDALSKSAEAVEGRWWRTLGVAVVIGFITSAPTLIIGSVLLFAPALVAGTFSSVANAIMLPFGISAMTLLYFDLQLRKESDDYAT